ncbi:hypothetical protein [Algicola sagamiensis]|uniref:hypothetical protein n=1 Tax=Algicola sagamiensis TaxID=163869 RepID=UPI000376DF44|nr:hypothetical protein [Algicola sagamiensis]
MGLFGGGNSSSNHHDNRVINDGEFAGNSGEIIANDGDYTAGNRNTGEYSGNSGTINITDGGSFNMVSDSVRHALRYGEEMSGNAFRFGETAIGGNIDIARDSIKGNTDLSESAISSMEELGGSALDNMADITGKSLDTSERVFRTLTDELSGAYGTFAENSREMMTDTTGYLSNLQSEQTRINRDNMAAITSLGKSAQTGGQSIIAESAAKMTYALMAAVALIGVAMMFRGS